jgi:hypothetical protein
VVSLPAAQPDQFRRVRRLARKSLQFVHHG